MTGRARSTEPGEPPKENTLDLLRLFAWGTLKSGYWNHDPFCGGALEIREARIRGRLYERPGFPVLEGPGRGCPRPGDRRPVGRHRHTGLLGGHTGAPVRSGGVVTPDPSPKAPQRVPGAPCTGSCSPSTTLIPALPAIDRLEGFRPGGSSLYRRVAGPGHGERRMRACLGLRGRDDRHQTPPDRLGLLAGVRSVDPKSILFHERMLSFIATFTCGGIQAEPRQSN